MEQPPRPRRLEPPVNYHPEPVTLEPLVFFDENPGDILDFSPRYSDPKEQIPDLLNRDKYSDEELGEEDYTENDEDEDEDEDEVVIPKTKEEILAAINPPKPPKDELLKLVTNNSKT